MTEAKLVTERRSRFGRWPTWQVELTAICATVGAFVAAPRTDRSDSIDALSPFFSSIAQCCVTLLVAVALFHGGFGGTVDFRVRRWISPASFVYLGLGTVVGIAGSIGSLDAGAYRLLFASSVGAGAGGLLTVLLMGAENINQQRRRAAAARAMELDPGPSERSGPSERPGNQS